MKLLPSRRVLCTPYNHASYHLMQSHICKVHAYLAVTCHLHFWQNDRCLLRATAVIRGWNGYRYNPLSILGFSSTKTTFALSAMKKLVTTEAILNISSNPAYRSHPDVRGRIDWYGLLRQTSHFISLSCRAECHVLFNNFSPFSVPSCVECLRSSPV